MDTTTGRLTEAAALAERAQHLVAETQRIDEGALNKRAQLVADAMRDASLELHRICLEIERSRPEEP